jgi:hypothetical protein
MMAAGSPLRCQGGLGVHHLAVTGEGEARIAAIGSDEDRHQSPPQIRTVCSCRPVACSWWRKSARKVRDAS